MLITKLKASAVNNLSDARYFSTFAEWIGFNFDSQQANAIAVATAQEMKGWLYGPRIVGEFGHLPINTINEVVNQLQLDTIQVDHSFDFAQLSPTISTVIRRIIIQPTDTITTIQQQLEAQSGVAYYLLDACVCFQDWKDWKNNARNWSESLLNWCQQYPILLSLPFDAEQVVTVVEQYQPMGIALMGGNELAIGLRSFEDIDPIIEALEEL